jgi:glycosyltransferase involved in cell wall biosynthesis
MVTRLRAALPSALFELAAVAVNVPDYVTTRKEIRQFRPDLLYKRHARFDIGALLAASRAGVRSVLEVNCLFSQPPYVQFEPIAFRAVATRMERRALTLATGIMCVSSPLARSAKALAGIEAFVVPNGADVRRFNPLAADSDRVRRRFNLGDRLVIGWVGVLRDWHGLELLLDALRELPAVQLLVVGDGPSRPAFEERAHAAGLSGRVTVTGRISHEEMPDYIAAMDVAVVADERTGVASPMKLLEYMAMGKAIVAPAMENIRDMVTDRINGLLFQPADQADLLGCLRELADDPSLRLAIGTKARDMVHAERTWRHIATLVLSRFGSTSR